MIFINGSKLIKTVAICQFYSRAKMMRGMLKTYWIGLFIPSSAKHVCI
jgi:hypothetical protein